MLEQKSSRPDDPDGSTRLSQGERVADLAPRIRLRSRLQAAEAEKPPTRLSVVQLPIDQIKTYNNPLLEHPPAQIEALTGNLRKLDFLAPLIVDKDFVLINGHALLEAARHASFKTVPVVILDHLTPLEVKTARIALNKLTDGRIWNKKALRIDMIEIEPLLIETGVGFEIVGFSSAESDLIISSRDAPIEDAPHLEPSKVAVTRAGEIWVMGPHRLL
jgi:ParB-like chromosome segregation protein Spo0J